MASDRRTGGRLKDHPDQLRAAFGRARTIDACCRTCLCSSALHPTRVANSSPLRHQRHRAPRAIRRSPNAHRQTGTRPRRASTSYGSELEHRRCRTSALARLQEERSPRAEQKRAARWGGAPCSVRRRSSPRDRVAWGADRKFVDFGQDQAHDRPQPTSSAGDRRSKGSCLKRPRAVGYGRLAERSA